MRRRSGFLTFLSSLIPGLGYMYLGLLKRGIQAMVIFFLIEPLFSLVGLGGIAWIARFPFWFYTFFDTFHIAHKMDRGELVQDTDFIFNQYTSGENAPPLDLEHFKNIENKTWVGIGWGLITLGILAILNKLFMGSELFYYIKRTVSSYFVPVAFVVLGLYLLTKKK